MTEKLRVDIWSDIACPWCYVGKRRLEAAYATFAQSHAHASPASAPAPAIEIVWRAFELDPSAPRESDPAVSYAQRLAAKYGCSVSEAENMITRMTDVARGDGLDFHFERVRPGNTFDAHRLLHLAHARGAQDALKERFLRGYLTEGAPIGARSELARMAIEAGLAAAEVNAVLEGDAYANEVRADEDEARQAGIRGVPFFVFGGKYAVSGAQPAAVLVRALETAWADPEARAHARVSGGSDAEEGAACGPEGCA